MSRDNPFADFDAPGAESTGGSIKSTSIDETLRPGARSVSVDETLRPGAQVPASSHFEPDTVAVGDAPAESDQESSYRPDNPLVGAATGLLNLMGALRNTAFHDDQSRLRREAVGLIKAFEAEARRRGIDDQTVVRARYALCSALDDVVHNTPWGGSGAWRQENLLVTFHREAEGGEKFFVILERLLQAPDDQRPLLELMYLCLCLGFQGRYRVLGPSGQAQLEEIRARVHRAIQTASAEQLARLSPFGGDFAVTTKARRRFALPPLWSVAALTAAFLLALYGALLFNLNRASDPPARALAALRPAPPLASSATMEMAAVAPSPARPTMPVDFLRREIDQGLVEVDIVEERLIVRFQGDGLFASGSAQVKEAFVPVIQRVGRSLEDYPGGILVTGHTDNIPIRTLRFPSNWHLSQARAEAVRAILTGVMVDPERVIAEGKSDAEPLVANDTPANRALNRRVDISLLSPVPPG